MYQYQAKLVRVVDGDTVYLDVDLGFSIHAIVNFRLAGIDAPEMSGAERPAGLASKAALEKMLSEITVIKGIQTIYVNCEGKDKYGRWVARLSYIASDGTLVDVGQRMLAEGYAQAVVY